MTKSSYRELELDDYLQILRNRFFWFIVPAVLFPAVAMYVSTSTEDSFDATARVLLSDSAAEQAIENGSQSINYLDRLLENEINLATSDQTVAEAAIRLDLPVDALDQIRVAAAGDADALDFTFRDTDPERAADIANVWAQTYVDIKRENSDASIAGAIQALETQLESIEAEREAAYVELAILEQSAEIVAPLDDGNPSTTIARTLDSDSLRVTGRIAQLDTEVAVLTENILRLDLTRQLDIGSDARIVTFALPPETRANSNGLANLILGVIGGLLIGAASALIAENLDSTIHATDLEATHLTVLGVVPMAKRRWLREGRFGTFSLDDPGSAQARAYHRVQTAVTHLVAASDIRSILITSPQAGDGKSTVASNLAIALAQANTRTALVDLDFHRPSIHRVFELQQWPGITTAATGRCTLEQAASTVASLVDTLVVIPAGKIPPNPGSFITSDGLLKLIKTLPSQTDLTIFDAPPVLPIADTLSLSPAVGGTVLVIHSTATKMADVVESLDALEKAGATVVGVVLVGYKQRRRRDSSYEAEKDVARMSPGETQPASSPARSTVRQNAGPTSLPNGTSNPIPAGVERRS